MYSLLNTLYVTTEGSYLRIDHETIKLEMDNTTIFQIPLLHIGSIVVFGNVGISPFVIHRCSDEGKTIVFLDRNGGFKARIFGPISGNVLLRKAQYHTSESVEKSLQIAKSAVAGKIQNSRNFTSREKREAKTDDDQQKLGETIEFLSAHLKQLESVKDMEILRGMEGSAARSYFSTLENMIKTDRESFSFEKRTRRPPRDRFNCLLSFLYTLLLNDCCAAIEAVGLDPQVGFLHTIRPGRPSLALDLMEEFRPIAADRLAVSLINLRQIQADDFEIRPGDTVYLKKEAYKVVLRVYQEKKQVEITHPFLQKKMPFGLVPHIQANLMAKFIRGDIENYIPFILR